MSTHKRDRCESVASTYRRTERRRRCSGLQTVSGCEAGMLLEPLYRHGCACTEVYVPSAVVAAPASVPVNEYVIYPRTVAGVCAAAQVRLPTRAVAVQIRHGNSGRHRDFAFWPLITLSTSSWGAASRSADATETETVTAHITIRGVVSHAETPFVRHREDATSVKVTNERATAPHEGARCGTNDHATQESPINAYGRFDQTECTEMSSAGRGDYFFEVSSESKTGRSIFACLHEQPCSAEVWLRQCAPLSAMLAECVARCVLEETGAGESTHGHTDILYQGHHICSSVGSTVLAGRILQLTTTVPALVSELAAPITLCVIQRT